MDAYQPSGFSWGLHLILVPLTFGLGFLLGWIIRSRAAKKERQRLRM